MASVALENQAEVRVNKMAKPVEGRRAGNERDSDEAPIELGIWLSGIESFLAAGHHSFGEARDERAVPDAAKEFRLVHAALRRCALLTARLLSELTSSAKTTVTKEIAFDELNELSAALRDATLLSEILVESTSVGPGEWQAWARLLSDRFQSAPAFSKLIAFAEAAGDRHLPPMLAGIASNSDPADEHAELALVLPRFGRILKWLSVVGRMLEADEPLKHTLLIFARVNEQIFEVTTYINNRLQRFPDEEAELFASLDAASYTASIELRKVYSQELAGVARMRPSPSVYARIETAYTLLSEAFQQILAGFARLVDPQTDIFKLFPAFQVKLEQSLRLRADLWSLTGKVRDAEESPEEEQIAALQTMLDEFRAQTVRYLFYKDSETVERFIEEIVAAKHSKDLVPLLHRFGAYLETLFGQVSLRGVLVDHPFDPQG